MTGPDQTSVHIVRRFAAPRVAVWQSWTDPAVVSRWFGSDPAGKVLSAQLDVRPGGSFAVAFVDSNQTAHTCRGVYQEVQAETKLTFTWGWVNEPGRESFVTVLLTPEGISTAMEFTHARLSRDSSHDYERGWLRTFAKLERLLESASASGSPVNP
jgi:uncharacterized protein YndB with AHSA1/START domain